MKRRILVVDDNEDVRLLVTNWLSGSYDIESAIDGNECISKIKSGKVYDLIFLDVMMPGPKPGDLVESIVKYLPKIKIIYLTAVEMFSPTEEQEKKGYLPVITEAVKGYLVKPVDKTQLINKINEVMELENLMKKAPNKRITKKSVGSGLKNKPAKKKSQKKR